MFRSRCDYAMEKCAVGDVPRQALGELRGYRCVIGPEQAEANLQASRAKAAVAAGE